MNKKILILVCLLVAGLLVFAGCDTVPTTGNRAVGNYDVQTFHYAYIHCGDKTIEGTVTQWRDYDNSDVVQIMIGGKYYLTHYSNVILVCDPEMGGVGYSNALLFGIDE